MKTLLLAAVALFSSTLWAGYNFKLTPLDLTLLTSDGQPIPEFEVKLDIMHSVLANGNRGVQWYRSTDPRVFYTDKNGHLTTPEFRDSTLNPFVADKSAELVISQVYSIDCHTSRLTIGTSDLRNLAFGNVPYSVESFWDFAPVEGKTQSGLCFHHFYRPSVKQDDFSRKLVCRSARVDSHILSEIRRKIKTHREEICRRLEKRVPLTDLE